MAVKQKTSKEPTHRKRRAEPNADKYFSRAVGKALDILEMFRRRGEPLSFNQVIRDVGLAKSSAFRMLHTLEKAGYLVKDASDRYMLSPSIAPLVPNHLQSKLVSVATPIMKELGREFRETVSLALLFENHIEVVAVVESGQKMQMGNVVGGIIPPHASSIGKSITACQPEQRREQLLRAYGICQFTPNTIVDELELDREFERIRNNGYAVDREESTLGGCCFGVPISGSDDQVIAGLSISMPQMRLQNEDRTISALRAAASAISTQLKTL